MSDKSPHDPFHKDLLATALQERGHADPQHTVKMTPEQWADVFFEPHDEAPPPGPRLRLLARMTCAPTVFEPFSQTVRPNALLDCLGKQLSLHRLRRPGKKAPKAARDAYAMAKLWILSPGKPLTGLAELWARSDSVRWMKGFYRLPEGLNAHVVVISELPQTEETLFLRFMGNKGVQLQALQEFFESTPNLDQEPMGRLLMRWRVYFLNQHPDSWDVFEQELAMNLEHFNQVVDQALERIRTEGHKEGRDEERLARRVFALRTAARFVDEATLERFHGIEEIDALEAEVIASIEALKDSQG